ncbi:DNA-directed RNA polymerase 2B/mitochondrial [Phytophthora fragariae]|uniref:DNA-directed RNA polymerase n=1 Tax=Phytophthora fragariae TaxID=53985 RepID=A0A6G0PA25_9STRA|nr:DNA-directed RNA polymerase 2B/mitochondrial [Phytophthora fragariae]KAE9240776.1 DNA-directed RNA polymerase 2B/mitochondrial [Phytophthora fragariae]
MQTSTLTTSRVARSALRRASSGLQRRSRMQHGALSLLSRSKSSLAPEAAMTEAAAADSELADEFETPPRLAEADWAVRAQQLIPRSTMEKPYELAPLTLGLEELIGKTEEELTTDELAKTSRSDMSDEDVDKWLEDFTIPKDQLARCSTPEEVQEMRRRYARQLRLECSVYEMAMDKYSISHEKVRSLGRSTETNAAKELIRKWMPQTEKYIEMETNKIRASVHSTDSNLYGPALLLLPNEVLAATGMNIMLNLCLMEPKGPKFIKLALAMGKAIQEEVIARKEASAKRNKGDQEKIVLYFMKCVKNESLRDRVKDYINEAGSWDKRLQLKVGAALIDFVQRTCYVPNENGDVLTPELCAAKGLPPPEPAFIHNYVFDRNRRAGVIQIHQRMADAILATNPNANVLPWTARYLPMLVPPRPWTDIVNGGYLKLRTKIMRQRDSAWQMDCVHRGKMDGILKALNLMADVPWIINKEVLDVVLKIWEDGGNFGDLPTRTDVPLPDPNSPEFADDPALYHKNVRKIEQLNREFHSLRCDTLYKLQVAEEFKDEPELYYPYNMDFRGRVYPIPPNLNHLGSDLSRSLLIFRDRKPLGERGLRWMKIHLANVFGVDKCSFDERVEFADAHSDKVVASASDPLGEGDCAWWKGADYPFLALGVCFELKRAIESPDPTKHMSNIPIHQDGSCNGLQHYAALGRDRSGGSQVNLVPAPRPSDVYMGVATEVMAKVEHDAELDVPSVEEVCAMLASVPDDDSSDSRRRTTKLRSLLEQAQRKKCAQFLNGIITRKVVKQTVMTSVYGVTYIGARKQISARLHETFLTKGHIMDEQLEDDIYHASCYCAELTMGSMGDLFNSARGIMAWLAKCAGKAGLSGQPMSWITPLGLPVVQPYRSKATKQIRTKVQHVLMVDNEGQPVSIGRQKSAFPPNFVHSLDSTHMMLTAIRCLEEEKISFAAVHDSYWTHACSVDIMNRRLREEFVNLYEQPLLEDLLTELRLRFPDMEFEDVPQLGDLDLRSVLDSHYFFN